MGPVPVTALRASEVPGRPLQGSQGHCVIQSRCDTRLGTQGWRGGPARQRSSGRVEHFVGNPYSQAVLGWVQDQPGRIGGNPMESETQHPESNHPERGQGNHQRAPGQVDKPEEERAEPGEEEGAMSPEDWETLWLAVGMAIGS